MAYNWSLYKITGSDTPKLEWVGPSLIAAKTYIKRTYSFGCYGRPHFIATCDNSDYVIPLVFDTLTHEFTGDWSNDF